MEYARVGFVAAIVGAVMGGSVGMLYGLYGVPHSWTMLSVAVNWAREGMVAGAVVGVIIGVVNWILSNRAITQRATGKLIGMVRWKAIRVLVGMVVGVIGGGSVGALIEIVIGVVTIRPFPNGTLLFPSGVIYIATAIGAIVGLTGGVIGKISDKVVRRVLGGMISGVVFAATIGILLVIAVLGSLVLSFSLSNLRDVIPVLVYFIILTAFLTIPISFFAILVTVMSEAIVERLFGDIPMPVSHVKVDSS